MTHEITERADGTAEAAFAMMPAWHGLGVVLDHPMSSREALTAAQLDWTVEQRPIAVGREKIIDDPSIDGGQIGILDWIKQDSHLANVRADNDLFLGMVSNQYKVVQNVESFEFMDELIENHEMQYESAFSLRGGKKVVLLGRLPRVREVVKDDRIVPYVLMDLCHDGTGAIHFGPCFTRVVCANTHAAALNERTVRELSIRHQGNVRDKLRQARTILGMATDRYESYVEIGRQLAKRMFTRDEWMRFLDVMCPEICPDDPDYTERRLEKILETRLALTATYRNERQLVEGAADTAWAAYNAVTEHIDHLPRRGATRHRRAEARFNVCLFGVGRNMKQRALEAACRIAEVECSLAS